MKMRWNLLDLGVGLGLVGLVVLGIRSYEILTTPQAPVEWKLQETLEGFCGLDPVDEETLLKIQPGDQELDPLGRVLTEVVDVDALKPGMHSAAWSAQLAIPVASKQPVQQRGLRLKLHGDRFSDGHFYHKGHPVIAGSHLELRTDRYAVTGKIQLGFEEERFLLLETTGKTDVAVEFLQPKDL